jgi:hypothetical protein
MAWNDRHWRKLADTGPTALQRHYDKADKATADRIGRYRPCAVVRP